jgi:hypothetical protein
MRVQQKPGLQSRELAGPLISSKTERIAKIARPVASPAIQYSPKPLASTERYLTLQNATLDLALKSHLVLQLLAFLQLSTKLGKELALKDYR